MSENENNSSADDSLNPAKPVGIQQGERSILSGGRSLTKLPLIIGFVIGIIVIALILITLVQASKSDTEVQQTMDDGGPGDSSGVPIDMFAGDKKSGAVAPLQPQQVATDLNCLTTVLDEKNNPVLNADGTVKQVPCIDPNQLNQNVNNVPMVVEGSAEDFANKRRLLELDRIRQKNEISLQREQSIAQARMREQDQRMQAMFERQNALAGVLNASSTVNGGGGSRAGGGASNGGGLAAFMPNASGMPGGSAMPMESGGEQDSFDVANGQTKKQSWAAQSRDSEIYLNKALIDPLSDYEVKAGTVIPGILVTGLNSDLPGQVIAQVSQNIYDTRSGKYLLIPQGTKLIGSYNSAVTYGQKRAMVAWERLIYPNGSSISINFAGVDQAGYVGVTDKVNNHYLKIFGQAALVSLFSAAGQIATNDEDSENKSSKETLSEELGRQWSQTGQELIRRNLNIAPTIKVRPGFRLNVMVSKDMILKPYRL